jgi:hypothetical protein
VLRIQFYSPYCPYVHNRALSLGLRCRPESRSLPLFRRLSSCEPERYKLQPRPIQFSLDRKEAAHRQRFYRGKTCFKGSRSFESWWRRIPNDAPIRPLCGHSRPLETLPRDAAHSLKPTTSSTMQVHDSQVRSTSLLSSPNANLKT